MTTNTIPIPPPKWLQRHIRNTLIFYPKTGDLIWTNPSSSNIKPGDPAGSINSRGYLQIGFKKKRQSFNVLVHHICWFLYYGEWPPKEVDHRNTIKTDNRIKNLRLATRSQAQRNRGLYNNNTSGVTGVYWNKKSRKWQVSINYKLKSIYRGQFVDFNQAVQERYRAEKEYFGRWRYSGFGKR